MLRNTILALVAVFTLSASANTSTNLPANTITISATIDKKDLVTIRGDKVWFTHKDGAYPRDIQINGNAWTPDWDEDQESTDFTMKEPPRFLPMNNRRGLLSISHPQTATVIEYPDVVNDWFLVIMLKNESDEPTQVDVTISWENDPMPIVLPSSVVPHTKPDPTPTGLR